MQEESKMSFEDRLGKLKWEANQALTMDDATAAPKIQRVQLYLRDRKNFKKFYSPNLLSIGPIHHDQENLKLGEKYGHATATVGHYCSNSQRMPPPQSLAQSPEESIIQVQQQHQRSPPHHLLDLLRTTLLSSDSKVKHGKDSSAANGGVSKNKGSTTYRVRSVQELKSVAIRVKKMEGASLNDISFTSNILRVFV